MPHSPGLQLSCSQALDSPVYDVLENPYATAGEGTQENDPSQNVYATLTEGCGEEDEIQRPPPRGNVEVSFLEEIYTTLSADRGNEDANIYESLRSETSPGNGLSASWSVKGMQSADQDYVSIVSDKAI